MLKSLNLLQDWSILKRDASEFIEPDFANQAPQTGSNSSTPEVAEPRLDHARHPKQSPQYSAELPERITWAGGMHDFKITGIKKLEKS